MDYQRVIYLELVYYLSLFEDDESNKLGSIPILDYFKPGPGQRIEFREIIDED